MPVRLRLARHGQKNTPYYHIVAINASKRRDAKPLEKLGEYDPIPRLPSTANLPSSSKVFGNEPVVIKKEKKVEWNTDRIMYWLGVGAQPTRTVVKLLERGGVLVAPHKWQYRWTPVPDADRSNPSSPSASESARPPRSRSKVLSSLPGAIASPAGETTGFAGSTAT